MLKTLHLMLQALFRTIDLYGGFSHEFPGFQPLAFNSHASY